MIQCPKYEKKASSTSSSSYSSSLFSSSEEAPDKVDILLTGRGVQLYGTWSKAKLLRLLTNRLKQCIRMQSTRSKKICYNAIRIERLRITVSKGLYSTYVLKKLHDRGMPPHTIVKAMKLGLISLNCCELCYFRDFNVDSYVLEFKEMWSNKFNDELILNLKPIGLTDSECWNIIIYGVMFQNSDILCHLILSGIDVPGILNWQSTINMASPEIIRFLKHIGIEKDIIQLVEQHGIDEETEQMLIDMGFNEMKEQFSNMEEVVCDRKSTTTELDVCSTKKVQDVCGTSQLKSTSSSIDKLNYFQLCSCQCHLAKYKSVAELNAQRNDYLRQNIMVPLSWAMARTLKHKPTDPIHYISYQLIHWIYMDEIKKDSVQEFIALSTIEMDRKFVEKKRLEEEELIREQNEKRLKNTVCVDPLELQCSDQSDWKCSGKSSQKYETCEFPEKCSSCKINVSNDST